jgi:hypothetical protein
MPVKCRGCIRYESIERDDNAICPLELRRPIHGVCWIIGAIPVNQTAVYVFVLLLRALSGTLCERLDHLRDTLGACLWSMLGGHSLWAVNSCV